MEQKQNNVGLIVLTVILFLLLIGSSGFAIYFWQKAVKCQNDAEISSDRCGVSENTSQTAGSPSEITDAFMKATLGTLPGSSVDYVKARSYMADDLKVQNEDDYFVPRFYGIQDGPQSVQLISENISGNNAAVKYNANWGEMGLGWSFSLVKENNQWKISEFRNDAQ